MFVGNHFMKSLFSVNKNVGFKDERRDRRGGFGGVCGVNPLSLTAPSNHLCIHPRTFRLLEGEETLLVI